MTDLFSSPAAESLLPLHATLSPWQIQILRLKSLVFLPTTKQAFYSCLNASGLRSPNGKGWTHTFLNAALDDLARLKLLTPEFACPPAALHPLAVEAIGSAEGEAMVAAVKREFAIPPHYNSYGYVISGTTESNLRLLRLAIYTNDAAAFQAQSAIFEKIHAPAQLSDVLPGMLMDADVTLDWLTSRHKLIQAAVFDALLVAASARAVPNPALPALIAHYQALTTDPAFAPIRLSLLAHHLRQGQVNDLQRELAATANLAEVPRESLAGTIAFLQGDIATALTHYRLALKLHRKVVGKRKVFLDGVNGIFFILAMLATNDATLQGEIHASIVAAEATTPQLSRGYTALQAVLWLSQGGQAKAVATLHGLRRPMTSDPVEAACIALAEWFLDRELAAKHRSNSAKWFDQLQNRMPLIARIFAELLTEISADATPYLDYLARTGLENALRFTRLLQTRAPWERALESLDAFLGGAEDKAAAAPPQRTNKRLAWFVDFARHIVEPVEQTAKGSGWTDGRPVSLKRLYERDPKLDYLTPADNAALRTLHRDTGGWSGTEYDFDAEKTMLALVGHPLVFDAKQRAQRVELVPYPVELVISAAGDGYRIALSHTASEPTIFVEAETPARYRVIEFPKKLLALDEILGAGGLTVPKAARDQVVAMVRRDNPSLPIRSEIADVAVPAKEGETIPSVQLTPHEAGLRLNLVVRPFGAEGPAYIAGLGGRSVLAEIAGQQQRINRDLPGEVAARDALIAACPTLRDRLGAQMHELLVDDLDGSLDLLLELQAYPGPVSIEWPQGRAMRVSAANTKGLRVKIAKSHDWFGVTGEVEVGADEVLDMQFLLERLERRPGRFVALEDGRFIALTRELQTQLSMLAAVSEVHKGGRRVHQFAAQALDGALDGAPQLDVDAAWKAHVARIRKATGMTPKLPATLQAELRDYQLEGFQWLARLAHWGAGACLADDMGLGKTVQSIAVMLLRAAEGPILVVAPTSVCPNWVSEITRFAPTLNPHRFAAASDRAALVAELGPQDVLVCSYGLLHQASELLAARDWSMLVLDEAQAIKNAGTKRAQASLEINAGFRLALTGTPIENYLDEMWSLMNVLNPGLLGSREAFQKRFAMPIERDRDAAARTALRTLIRPFLLRRTKAAVLSELPARTEQTITIEMGEAERVFYEAVRQRALATIDELETEKGTRKIHILAEITRLRRACCNPALIDPAINVPSAKLDSVMELVDELIRNNHRALIFSQFTGHLALVRAALEAQNIAHEYLDGSTPAADRERRVAAFQSGSAPLFLISLRAGGTGLNLTAADYVIHLDPWWNPAVEDQASSRAHRLGQERPVTVYRLVMQDSIEEKILHMHRDKRDLANDLLEGGEMTARLSEEELLDLLRV
jgi:superfamily II DNA or RNA helicase